MFYYQNFWKKLFFNIFLTLKNGAENVILTLWDKHRLTVTITNDLKAQPSATWVVCKRNTAYFETISSDQHYVRYKLWPFGRILRRKLWIKNKPKTAIFVTLSGSIFKKNLNMLCPSLYLGFQEFFNFRFMFDSKLSCTCSSFHS